MSLHWALILGPLLPLAFWLGMIGMLRLSRWRTERGWRQAVRQRRAKEKAGG